MTTAARSALLALAAALAPACGGEPDLVIYCALDQIHSEPLLERFVRETGLDVRMEFDIEQSKTVGLVRRLIEEAENPRCDVFWNNEVAQTIRLAERGLLETYDSPSAEAIPERFRDPERRWTGFAARARVFIVNTEKADAAEIDDMWDLLDPRWEGQVGIARPLTGTTLTHAAALFDVLGEERALEYLTRIRDAGEEGDVSVVGSNGQLMRLVREGELAWGWTDTDDYNVARDLGYPVDVVYPDQCEDCVGTMLIPNTVSILKGAPHPEAARELVDWILSEEVEAELAASRSAQIPVRPSVPRPQHVLSIGEFREMEVDYAALGARMEERTELLKELFIR